MSTHPPPKPPSAAELLLQGGNILPDNMNVTRITFCSQDAENLSDPIPTPGATATQSDDGSPFMITTPQIGTNVAFNVTMASMYVFLVGSTVTGTNGYDPSLVFTGTVVSSTGSDVVLTIATAPAGTHPPLTNWNYSGIYASPEGPVAQDDLTLFEFTTVGQTFSMVLDTYDGFIVGTTISGSANAGANTFTATVTGSTPLSVDATITVIDPTYDGVNGFVFTGTTEIVGGSVIQNDATTYELGTVGQTFSVNFDDPGGVYVVGSTITGSSTGGTHNFTGTVTGGNSTHVEGTVLTVDVDGSNVPNYPPTTALLFAGFSDPGSTTPTSATQSDATEYCITDDLIGFDVTFNITLGGSMFFVGTIVTATDGAHSFTGTVTESSPSSISLNILTSDVAYTPFSGWTLTGTALVPGTCSQSDMTYYQVSASTIGTQVTFATLGDTLVVGTSVTGTVSTYNFTGTVYSSSSTSLVVTVATEWTGYPAGGVNGWEISGLDDGVATAVQSDSGVSYLPIVGSFDSFAVSMGTPGQVFCPGSVITGTYQDGVFSASFTATVTSSTTTSFNCSFLTVNDPYGVPLTGWSFAGSYSTTNYNKLKYRLPYPLRKVVFADWTYITNQNFDQNESIFLEVKEFNNNTCVTSKGVPYWRYVTSGNFITQTLPSKLQPQKDYNELTFELFNCDGTVVDTGGTWSVEIQFYQIQTQYLINGTLTSS